jgi:hypothetical protein
MVKSCNECGVLFSPYEPVKKGNQLLICENCLRITCKKCSKKSKGKCPDKKCKGPLRALDIEELD